MSTIQFIGDLATIKKKFTEAGMDSSVLLPSILLGDEVVSEYDSSKTYNAGDRVIVYDEAGNATIYTAKENGITGEFDSSKWSSLSLFELLNKTQRIWIGKEEPQDMKEKDIWLQSFDPIEITFVPNNDVDEEYTVSCEYGDPIDEPEPPTKEGYTFMGWVEEELEDEEETT